MWVIVGLSQRHLYRKLAVQAFPRFFSMKIAILPEKWIQYDSMNSDVCIWSAFLMAGGTPSYHPFIKMGLFLDKNHPAIGAPRRGSEDEEEERALSDGSVSGFLFSGSSPQKRGGYIVGVIKGSKT